MLQKLTSKIRKVVEDYDMIQEGDKIAVGLSGGKDSLCLLLCLNNLKRFYPKKFEIMAITIDMGFEGFDVSGLEKLCKENNIEYIVHKTSIGEIIFDVRQEKNPCSLCANFRRGALNDIAKKHGCNKVALGHHLDDVVETFFLSLFFESRINSFKPITYLSRTEINVIRPMIYVTEAEVKGFANKANLPVVHNPCPANCNTKRQEIKDLIKTFTKLNPNVKRQVFTAIEKELFTNEKKSN